MSKGRRNRFPPIRKSLKFGDSYNNFGSRQTKPLGI